MSGQFELGTIHQENIKNTQAVLSEISLDKTREAIKALYERNYGFLPSEKTPYADYLGLVLSLEEIAKKSSAVAASLVDQIVFQELLAKYATESGKNAFDTTEVYGNLCGEAGNNSFSAMNTTAVKSATGWTVSGKKLISKEQLISDKYAIYAKDEDSKIRVFLVKADDVDVCEKSKEIAGTKISLNHVVFNLELSDDANIAVINDDYERNMSIARTLVAAVSLGLGHSAIVAGVAVSKETKDSNNQSISGTQSVQFTLADMFAEVESGRMLTYYSASYIDEKKPSIKFATFAKIQSTDAASAVSMQALQLLGNMGYIANDSFAGLIENAITAQAKGGTNRVQRNQAYQFIMAKK